MINLPNRIKPIITKTNKIGCELITNRAVSKSNHVKIRVDGVYYFAHRLAYEQEFGEIPKGLVVRHKCDNGNCINPNHLELGTHEDNVNDRVKRGRSAIGSNNGRAKLSEDDVRYIRNNKDIKVSELAKLFNVDPKAIRSIKDFKTWKHVD